MVAEAVVEDTMEEAVAEAMAVAAVEVADIADNYDKPTIYASRLSESEISSGVDYYKIECV